MSKANRIVAWCFLLVALSFWLNIAWAYLTRQDKSSFFVGPAVVVMGGTLFIDTLLVLYGVFWAGYGLWKRQITFRQACVYWPILLLAVIASFYLTNALTLYLFPYFGRPLS
jgi:hypothetical protein